MQFGEIFREERYYCNHLFRLMCHNKENGNGNSGLAAILKELDIPGHDNKTDIMNAQIYTEVAVFRDVYKAVKDRNGFIDQLYNLFLPVMISQYSDETQQPSLPVEIREKHPNLHPRDYGRLFKDQGNKENSTFYKEFSALFSAKPDFLIVFQNKMLWFEAKFWESFSYNQFNRTKNIANLCGTDLFSDYFGNAEPIIVLLGSEKRHKNAQKYDNSKFLSWESCHEIAQKLLPGGKENYTVKSFASMLNMKQ